MKYSDTFHYTYRHENRHTLPTILEVNDNFSKSQVSAHIKIPKLMFGFLAHTKEAQLRRTEIDESKKNHIKAISLHSILYPKTVEPAVLRHLRKTRHEKLLSKTVKVCAFIFTNCQFNGLPTTYGTVNAFFSFGNLSNGLQKLNQVNQVQKVQNYQRLRG